MELGTKSSSVRQPRPPQRQILYVFSCMRMLDVNFQNVCYNPNNNKDYIPSKGMGTRDLLRKRNYNIMLWRERGKIDQENYIERREGKRREGQFMLKSICKTIWKPTTIEVSSNIYIHKRNLNGVTSETMTQLDISFYQAKTSSARNGFHVVHSLAKGAQRKLANITGYSKGYWLLSTTWQ